MANRRGAGSSPGDEASTGPEGRPIQGPSADQVSAYIEDMLSELAKLAASAGRHSLATTLWIASVEAGQGGKRSLD